MARELGEAGAGLDRGRLRGEDLTLLVGIAGGHAPALVHPAGEAKLEALGALAVDQDGAGGVGGVGHDDIAALETVQGRGE